MSLENIFLLFGCLFCLLSGFIGFGILSRSSPQKPLSATIILGLTFVVSSAYAIFNWHDNDFISQASVLAFLMPLLTAIPLVALIFFPLKGIFRWLVFFCLACITLISCHIETILFSNLPLWANQIIVAFLWSIIAVGLRVLNGKPVLVVSEVLGTGFGIFILSLIGAAPFALGLSNACLFAASLAFLFYNWEPPALSLKDSEADLLGFIIGGQIAWCVAEGAGAPAVIFIMLFICELLFALAQKLTFLPAFADIKQNTAYAKSISSGLSQPTVASHFLRINLLLVLFGCFQVYAPNQISIPLVCAAVTAWQMYRLIHWSTLTSGIRETNQAVAAELKKNFAEIKKHLNKDK